MENQRDGDTFRSRGEIRALQQNPGPWTPAQCSQQVRYPVADSRFSTFLIEETFPYPLTSYHLISC